MRMRIPAPAAACLAALAVVACTTTDLPSPPELEPGAIPGSALPVSPPPPARSSLLNGDNFLDAGRNVQVQLAPPMPLPPREPPVCISCRFEPLQPNQGILGGISRPLNQLDVGQVPQ